MKTEDKISGAMLGAGCLGLGMYLIFFGLMITGLALGVRWLWMNT